MKKIVRLTESDLARIVKRVILEQDQAFIEEIDTELDTVSEEDPGPIETIIKKIQDAGHDVKMFAKKLRRNGNKFLRHLKNNFQEETVSGKTRFKRIARNIQRNIQKNLRRF